jgi:hypothetical protein
MIGFLKSFFSNEKSTEEQALVRSLTKQRDVMVVDAYAMGEDEEEQGGNCAGGGCGGCACHG